MQALGLGSGRKVVGTKWELTRRLEDRIGHPEPPRYNDFHQTSMEPERIVRLIRATSCVQATGDGSSVDNRRALRSGSSILQLTDMFGVADDKEGGEEECQEDEGKSGEGWGGGRWVVTGRR